MAELYRAQVLLERKQHEALQTLAAAEGRSMSEIIREAVAAYLVERDEERELQDWERTLEELTKIREEIRARFGTLNDDFILRNREERDEELWQRMMGEE
jgi:predicted transcriptional regulator